MNTPESTAAAGAPRIGAFFHIAKAAGISVRLLAERHERLIWVNTRAGIDAHRFGVDSAICVDDIPELERRALFVFTFVRNPFERFVSCWRMFCERPERGSYRGSFAEFVDLVTAPGMPLDVQSWHRTREQWDSSPECMRHHLVPQVERLRQLHYALGREPDFVGRVERIQSDWAAIAARLGIDAPVPHRNRTVHHHYSAYYDRATRSKVEAHSADDLHALSYRFEPRLYGVRRVLLRVPERWRQRARLGW
jgi:hypothetical protein